MDEYIIDGNVTHKISPPMVDFKYNEKKNKGSRKSMFQIFSPKKIVNNNPKDIYNASNKINSILSKNLKSIIHENKNEITKDKPLLENVNCLIKKNSMSNKYLYNQIINFRNNIKNNKYNLRESLNSPGSNKPERRLGNSTIIQSKNKIKNDDLFRTSIKNSSQLKNQIENLHINKSKFSSSIRNDTRISENIKEKKILEIKKGNSSKINRLKFTKKPTNNETETLYYKDELNKLFKENSLIGKRHNSTCISPNNNRNEEFKEKKSRVLSKKNIRANLNKRRFTTKIFNNKFEFSSKSKPKLKATRHSVFVHATNSPKKNMKIPTLQQINNAITKSYIESRIEKIRKELDDLDHNEVSEILDNLPKNKNESIRDKSLPKFNLKQKIEIDKSEKNELLKTNVTNITLKEQIENQQALEEDRFQKKYRKLFLNKNLYDSLDDEEVVD